jgi:hypothetical protein
MHSAVGKRAPTLSWTTTTGERNEATFSISAAEFTDDRQMEFVIAPQGAATTQWRFP